MAEGVSRDECEESVVGSLGAASEEMSEAAPAKRCATLRSSTSRNRSAVRFHSAGAAPFCRRPRATSIETNCPAGLDGICACAYHYVAEPLLKMIPEFPRELPS